SAADCPEACANSGPRRTGSSAVSVVVDPDPAKIGRADAVLDPSHPGDPGLDAREAQGRQGCRAPRILGQHGLGEPRVQIGPGLEETLGMARADAVIRK